MRAFQAGTARAASRSHLAGAPWRAVPAEAETTDSDVTDRRSRSFEDGKRRYYPLWQDYSRDKPRDNRIYATNSWPILADGRILESPAVTDRMSKPLLAASPKERHNRSRVDRHIEIHRRSTPIRVLSKLTPSSPIRLFSFGGSGEVRRRNGKLS